MEVDEKYMYLVHVMFVPFLDSFISEWDRMDHVVDGFGLDNATLSSALTTISQYISTSNEE